MAFKFYQSVKKIATDVSLIRFLFVSRLVFGFYFQISTSKLVSYFIKLYCIFICPIVCFFYFNFYLGINYGLIVCLEYIFIVIIYLIFAEGKFFKFLIAIKTGDSLMGFKNMSLIPFNIFYLISITLFFRFVSFALRLHYKYNTTLSNSMLINRPVFFTLFLQQLLSDTNYWIVSLIFSILHSRIKQLRLVIEGNSIPININRDNAISICIRNTRKTLYNYDYLLDNVLLVNQLVQSVILGTLMIKLPGIICATYRWSKQILFGEFYTLPNVMFILESAHFITSLCFPVMLVELAMQEVDHMKITLSKQILKCSDETLRLELEVALQYVSMRPFNYIICRVVPMNANLIFTIIGLIITYVIVIIQFHFT